RAAGRGLAAESRQAFAVEDVVAEDQRDRPVADELPADEERLRQSVGRWLLGIGQEYAVIAAVSQQLAELRQVARRRNDENLADASKHQHAERVVDHRLVEDRQQLLRYGDGDRVEPCAGAAG